MPTALGHMVLNGASFEQVVWFAARSLVMHDYSPNEQVKFGGNPDDDRYLASLRSGLDQNLTELAQLEAMSNEEYEQDVRAAALKNAKMVADVWNADNAKLDAMLVKVAEWKLPEGVPEALRLRIREWLVVSKEADVQGWYDKETERLSQSSPSRQEAIEWQKKYVEETERKIERHIAYVAERKAWLQALDAAIPQPESYTVVKP